MFHLISFYLSSNKNLFNDIENYNISPQYRACNNQKKKNETRYSEVMRITTYHHNNGMVGSFMELNDLMRVHKQMGYHLHCIYLFTHAWSTKLVFWANSNWFGFVSNTSRWSPHSV